MHFSYYASFANAWGMLCVAFIRISVDGRTVYKLLSSTKTLIGTLLVQKGFVGDLIDVGGGEIL